MEQLDEYQGLCPLCYKPVTNQDDKRQLKNDEKTETYHASCLHDYVINNTPGDANTQSLGMTLLEQYKELLVDYNTGHREQWIASKADEWQYRGAILRAMREQLNITAKTVADKLGISLPRLKRFEDGLPVKDAKMLEKSYDMFFEIHLTMQLLIEKSYEHNDLLKQIIDQGGASSETKYCENLCTTD